jgi:hypothetical protein
MRTRISIALAFAILGCLVATSSAVAAPRLSYGDANNYASIALHRHFKGAFDHGYGLRGGCGRRLGNSSRFCPNISWYIGDLSYSGWVKIWVSHGYWYYRLKITRTDEYCLSVQQLPPAQCTDTTYVK